MEKTKGVYTTTKKDGSFSYRSSITYKSKHISLGSYSKESQAIMAYTIASKVLFEGHYHFLDFKQRHPLSLEKWVVIMNYRDKGLYFRNPIYLHKTYFSYYLSESLELKFDVDDLFYYSNHKIFQKKGRTSDLGYLFVNDFGMQVNILSRYGIKNHAVLGKDYIFIDGDCTNLTRQNIQNINPYYGVEVIENQNSLRYQAKINVKGKYVIGYYKEEILAAIAYNKAADFIEKHKISSKSYPRNYIVSLDSATYQSYYQDLAISSKLLALKTH